MRSTPITKIFIAFTMKLSTLTLLIFLFIFDQAYALSYEAVSIIDGLKSFSQLQLPHSVFGSESVAFDCHGKGPYVGVSDGRILKWQETKREWTDFAVTSPRRDKKLCDGLTSKSMESMCGRPLGLKFNTATCELYIADAYFGLLVVGLGGGVARQLATSADGVPFRFTNALDIDTKTGEVYFTDSSILFQRRVYVAIILSGDRTGRLLKYVPSTKNVHVLLKGLAFPNGVALSKDNSFLLLAESTTLKILKIHLRSSEIHAIENFAQLPRSPDNIKRNAKGEFWVALNSGRGKIQSLENKIGSTHQWSADPVAVKFDEEGNAIEVLDGKYGQQLNSVSEVLEYGERLWIGSAVQPYVGVIKA
ncbi:protein STRICTOSIDINE SYNTHASE-LIKE 10-like [Abrus precatorius]|uniref:Protein STRICTOSIDINE SYNTHASE-LIKE 10-like n=1 Tax=Abrus precatorius TaxID=3816 RepID=A0A8B8KXU1_ABRPR|nr:protein STRICTOSIDINE SYNTHASE-LIKE 10-like [Abrus precatorius]